VLLFCRIATNGLHCCGDWLGTKLGFPLGQELEDEAGVVFVDGRLVRPPMMMLLPPMRLMTVAWSWCPGSLCSQVALVWARLRPRPWDQQYHMVHGPVLTLKGCAVVVVGVAAGVGVVAAWAPW
jgi:hypothetical protein